MVGQFRVDMDRFLGKTGEVHRETGDQLVCFRIVCESRVDAGIKEVEYSGIPVATYSRVPVSVIGCSRPCPSGKRSASLLQKACVRPRAYRRH